MTALLVALGAAVGAPARYLLDGLVRRLVPSAVPLGTLVVNVLGSLVLGVAVGVLREGPLAVVGTGFCGAFTTYSAFAYEVVSLPRRRALAYVGLSLGLGIGAAWLGWVLGQRS